MLPMPRPYSQYVFKYSHKGTQKEDSQTYDKLFSVIEKFLHDQKKLNPLAPKHIEEYFLLHLLIKITMLLEQQWLLALFKTNQCLYFCMKLYGVR